MIRFFFKLKFLACSGCIFPFIYSANNKRYNGCTKEGDSKNWCPTKLEKDTYISGSGFWKYCDGECPVHSDKASAAEMSNYLHTYLLNFKKMSFSWIFLSFISEFLCTTFFI